MKLYSFNNDYKLYQGNMLDMLEVIPENSIDSIVCDPPYELGFMGKSWDSTGIAFQKETWEKCLKVLKPGGHLLAFSGSRTYHRMACAIEDAGFEIRDCIMWLYGQAMPKSLNVGLAIDEKNGVESEVIGTGKSGGADTHSRTMHSVSENGKEVFGGEYQIRKANNEWNGYFTGLKPAYEPIVVARKPLEGTVVENIEKYRTGALNIDECRIPFQNDKDYSITANKNQHEKFGTKPMTDNTVYGDWSMVQPKNYASKGRYPANVIHDGSDEATKDMPYSKGASSQNNYSNGHIYRGQSFNESNTSLEGYREWYNDEGSASRYFYCAKASKFDRDEGLDNFEESSAHSKGNGLDRVCEFCGVSQLTPELCHCPTKSWVAKPRKNIHTTVKPTELMRYLVRLVSPKGATILDPFNGSGSTGKAVMLENKQYNKNYKYIGIELTEEYLPISKARIEYICNTKFDFWKDENGKEQRAPASKAINIFDFLDEE